MPRPELSVIIPVYYSAEIFPELYRRVKETLDGASITFELLAIVDGCKDESANVVASIHERDPRVKLVEFSRNFGEEAGVSAGLRHCEGEAAMVMDDDLEDPPEIIPEFLAKLREGYDLVYGVIKKRKVSWFRRAAFYMYYRILNKLANLKMPADAGSLAIMRREVIDALNELRESNLYIRGLRVWVGFKQTGLEYDRHERYAGESAYNFRKYLQFAFNGILSFSYKPLRLVTGTGLVVALSSFLFTLWILYQRLAGHLPDVPGYASMTVIVLFLGGAQLIAIGAVGEYIARIYDETKRRPRYVIKRALGVEPKYRN
ncbi:MAG: glycosyltransferase [Ignavibacteriales bacterium]|nr:glycosyltransferase [Ignavibacteriales bacterium]